MAYSLPAAGSWPGLTPEEFLEPGQDHFGQQVEDVIEEQHWSLAKLGRSHVGQRFGDSSDVAKAAGAGTSTLVATYLIWQSKYEVGIQIGCIVSSDGGVDVRILAVEPALVVAFTLAAGANVISSGTDTLALARGDQVTTIEVYLDIPAGGTEAELHDLSIAATDLVVGDLP